MKLKLNHFIIFTLLYPLWFSIPFIVDEIGFIFTTYYFLILFIVGLLISLFNQKKTLRKESVADYIILFLLFLLICWNTDDPRYSLPLVFILFISLFYYLFSILPSSAYNRPVTSIFILYVFFSLIALLDEGRFENQGRFAGFSGSPTTYSVFLIAILIIYLDTAEKWIFKLLAFVVVGIFVLFTETRLNFFYFLVLPFLLPLVSKFPKLKFILFFLFVISLNLVYPIHNYLISNESNELLTARYDGGIDTSFRLRYSLFTNTYEEFLVGNTAEKLFGRGSEFSRLLILEKFNFDHRPHNDFIRFITDFGIVGFCLFMTLIYRFGRKSKVSFILLTLYLLTFYHNMIYNFYLILLIMLLGSVRLKKGIYCEQE